MRGIWLIALMGCAAAASGPAKPSVGVTANAKAAKRGAHAEGMAAYERKEYAACAGLFVKAEDPYSAACCYARGGQVDLAFAQLGRAIEDGFEQDLMRDDDLAALHGDPRWQAALARQAAKREAHERTLNGELVAIYRADQADRAVASYEQIDWSQVGPRDHARRARVDAIVAAGGARVADDYYHAAMVYQHGETIAEVQRAHDLAMRAVELEPGHKRARWLAAASEDRVLSYGYKAQKWGTQFKKVDGKWIVWPVDPAITDDQREVWNVPPLAEADAHVAAMNAKLEAAKADGAKADGAKADGAKADRAKDGKAAGTEAR